MSVEAMAWALQQRTGSVSNKAVLLALADRAGFDWACWPSQATIAYETELSERTVRTVLGNLELAGLIRRERRHRRDGSRTSDRTVLLPANIAAGAPTGNPRPDLPATDGTTYRQPVAAQEPSDEPSVGTTTSSRAALEIVDGRFDTFWDQYPRKVDKKDARKVFDRLMKTVDHEDILIGLDPWLDYWEERGDPSFIPHPTTWLNKERWLASPPELKPNVSKGTAALMEIVKNRSAQ